MIKGQHVGLRAIEREDLSTLLHWRNQPNMRQFFREYRELNMDMQLQWFENTVIKNPAVKMFAIIDLKDNILLGACGLCYIDWVNQNADFSIYIGYNNLYIDDLYAMDAARLLITYGFDELNLHRLWAEIYSFDSKKQHFFETLGFHLDGRHKETHWANGEWHDSLYYGLIRSKQK